MKRFLFLQSLGRSGGHYYYCVFFGSLSDACTYRVTNQVSGLGWDDLESFEMFHHPAEAGSGPTAKRTPQI